MTTDEFLCQLRLAYEARAKKKYELELAEIPIKVLKEQARLDDSVRLAKAQQPDLRSEQEKYIEQHPELDEDDKAFVRLIEIPSKQAVRFCNPPPIPGEKPEKRPGPIPNRQNLAKWAKAGLIKHGPSHTTGDHMYCTMSIMDYILLGYDGLVKNAQAKKEQVWDVEAGC